MTRYLITLLLALASASTLCACGGSDDDEPDPATCYVDGKAMSREACR